MEKTLTLLHFKQHSNGKQHTHGFRIVTEHAQDATAGDATELTKKSYYATVALCTVEKTTDFTAAKDITAMAVVMFMAIAMAMAMARAITMTMAMAIAMAKDQK